MKNVIIRREANKSRFSAQRFCMRQFLSAPDICNSTPEIHGKH